MKAAYEQSFLIKLENYSKLFEPEMYENDKIFWSLWLWWPGSLYLLLFGVTVGVSLCHVINLERLLINWK